MGCESEITFMIDTANEEAYRGSELIMKMKSRIYKTQIYSPKLLQQNSDTQ